MHEDDIQARTDPVTLIDSSNRVDSSTKSVAEQSEHPSKTVPGFPFTGSSNLVDSSTETAAEQSDEAPAVQFGPAKCKHECEAIIAVDTLNNPFLAIVAEQESIER